MSPRELALGSIPRCSSCSSGCLVTAQCTSLSNATSWITWSLRGALYLNAKVCTHLYVYASTHACACSIADHRRLRYDCMMCCMCVVCMMNVYCRHIVCVLFMCTYVACIHACNMCAFMWEVTCLCTCVCTCIPHLRDIGMAAAFMQYLWCA